MLLWASFERCSPSCNKVFERSVVGKPSSKFYGIGTLKLKQTLDLWHKYFKKLDSSTSMIVPSATTAHRTILPLSELNVVHHCISLACGPKSKLCNVGLRFTNTLIRVLGSPAFFLPFGQNFQDGFWDNQPDINNTRIECSD